MRARHVLLPALGAALLAGCASTPLADRVVYATSDAPPPALAHDAPRALPAESRSTADLDEDARRAWLEENEPQPAYRAPRVVVRERVIVRERSEPVYVRERPWYRSYALPLFLLAGYGIYRAHRHYDRHHGYGHHDWHVGVGYHHW